ncbi:MAG: class I adenylate-forming enzyme family protein [Paracoccaceae bacterium]
MSARTDPSQQTCPAAFNLAEYVLAGGRDTPDKIALQIVGTGGAERWSYARLAAAVGGTAAGLLALGLCPGDRVLMRLANSVDFPIVFLGAIAAGLVPVPTSSQLTGRETDVLTRLIGPALIVAGPGIALPDPVPCPVIGPDELASMRTLPSAGFVRGDPGRPAYIVMTSGTAGSARAVVHAHRAIWARRLMRDGWTGMNGADRVLHAGAFNWTYTLGTGLLDPWSLGATALIPADGTKSDGLPLLLKRYDATIFAAAPGIYRQLLKQNLPALPKLRHGLSAGEALPQSLRQRWHAATGTDVHEAFGMSECSTFLSGSPARPAPPGTLGYPQPGRRVAIVDEAGQPLGHSQPGTIAIHRDDPGLYLGYLDAPEATEARFSGLWFVTGDQGVMAPDGAIAYLGRDDDQMNAGGYRVSPLDVEAAFAHHPALAEVAACELRVGPETSVIALFYVAHEEVSEAELTSFAEGRLARYKQPRIYRRLDHMPRSANGKVLRRALRENHGLTDDKD